MISLLLTFSFLSCVSSGAMLSMLLWLIAAYVLSAIWLITQGAVYSGLLYVLVYVGAIVVLIMFVVQLTNTSLTLNISTFTPKLVIIQNLLLLLSFSFLLA
jgi:NADH:ubiquinone oxidoreductase subunit 6 (subunit J)